MNKKQFNIEDHEEEILEDFEKGKFVSVRNLKTAKNIARKLEKSLSKYGRNQCHWIPRGIREHNG